MRFDCLKIGLTAKIDLKSMIPSRVQKHVLRVLILSDPMYPMAPSKDPGWIFWVDFEGPVGIHPRCLQIVEHLIGNGVS